ncbi:bifunctional serine/threonine-protein kinase/ABC transporter substrate-binding protein [Streptomyces sp. CAU 1734]|uniref:bifunctional serine/threonine-protein kinase/ABC transporter substrate-binding protein n=1 Tax=Streptomyces sp. CAU 1734 TaxID=3140360 RepID=UPI00326145B8
MDPLKTGDPSAVAGFRLLGRLGAGGMGVVYLARTGGGAPAALKVIRAEHAADPGFRARFRRETEIARRVTGHWVVRVVDADPEAREPWLATEFIPGPSLSEAVAAHGALPEHTVRILGARLAEALDGAHREGLVHRDVKPGNVLLALDGPRLIDFGIARTAGATALTATGAVIGSPGYLSPEQARAGGAAAVGPASDIFSLGCVLAHAATGRRPFGVGTVPAILFRTVHEEPDLDGVPPALLGLVRSCLDKDPAARPTAVAIRAALGGPAGADTSTGTDVGTDWLPAGLPGLIAERSARVLDLPVPEPTLLVSPAPAGAAASRRRFLALGSAAAVVAAGSVTTWLIRREPDGSGTTATRGGPLPVHTIGIQTDLSGPRGADGRAQERGARLAVESFNARAGRPFDLRLKVLDDAGDRARARLAATAHVSAAPVVAVLGPVTGDTVREVAAIYLKAGLPLVSVSADAGMAMPGAARRAYYELRPADRVLLTCVTAYLAGRRVRGVTVVEDLAGGDLSWNIATSLREAPPGLGEISHHQVPADSEDFASAARTAVTKGSGGVVYAGSSPVRAALLARALAGRGHTGPCGAPEPVLQPEFLARAGKAAEGWVFGTSYIDPAEVASARPFLAAYRKRWKTEEAGRYAAEAYDAVHFIARGMSEPGERIGRARLAQRLRTVEFEDGIVKPVVFRDSTELIDESRGGMYVHRVEGGRPRFLGSYREL